MTDGVRVDIADGVGRLTLDRPETHNAFDEPAIAALTAAIERVTQDARVRVVVLDGAGPVFCSGADLGWMRRAAGYTPEQNKADADRLALLMQRLDQCPKPTIAQIQGSAFGGGLGLIAACDLAVAVDTAEFCASEVRIGLIPAVVSPYVLRAIGPRAAGRWFLTAERMSAETARRIGLIHDIAAADQLGATVDRLVRVLLANSPGAIAATKQLIRGVAGRPIDDPLIDDTARRIAAQRASADGREGVAAFLEKRPAAWAPRLTVAEAKPAAKP